MEQTYELTVNGLSFPAVFDTEDVEGVFLPLLEHWTQLQRKLGRRTVVFMAAPPGTGKSTLALFLEALSHSTPGVTPLQAVGLDGFHHPQAYLNTHFIPGTQAPLSTIKGAPESFDVEALLHMLADARTGDPRWPLYDRQIHDVRKDQIPLTEQILLLEGNYLLLEEEPWTALRSFRDHSIFLSADPAALEGRLVSRKMAGGASREEAEAYVRRVDLPNIRRVLDHSAPAELTLRVEGSRFLPLP